LIFENTGTIMKNKVFLQEKGLSGESIEKEDRNIS